MQELLTYEQAARETGRSVHTIKYYVSRNMLKAYPIPHSHRKGIKPEDIAAFKRMGAFTTQAEMSRQAEPERAALPALPGAHPIAWTEQDRVIIDAIGNAFAPGFQALRDTLASLFRAKGEPGASRLDEMMALMLNNPRAFGEQMAQGMAANDENVSPEKKDAYIKESGEYAERTVRGMVDLAHQPARGRQEREKVPA